MGMEDFPGQAPNLAEIKQGEAKPPNLAEEAARILAQLNQELKSADSARFTPTTDAKTGRRTDIDSMTSDDQAAEAQHADVMDLAREAGIIADPEVQAIAEKYANKPDEITKRKKEIAAEEDEISGQERIAGGKRTESQQKALDQLRTEKNGLIMAGNGGLEQTVKNLITKSKLSGIDLEKSGAEN
jgi:hypothetical protein